MDMFITLIMMASWCYFITIPVSIVGIIMPISLLKTLRPYDTELGKSLRATWQINGVSILLLFYLLLSLLLLFFSFLSRSMWDLSSPTRDWLVPLHWKRWVLTTALPRRSLFNSVIFSICRVVQSFPLFNFKTFQKKSHTH